MKPIIKPNIKPTTRIMTLALGSLVCSVAINGYDYVCAYGIILLDAYLSPLGEIE